MRSDVLVSATAKRISGVRAFNSHSWLDSPNCIEPCDQFWAWASWEQADHSHRVLGFGSFPTIKGVDTIKYKT